MSEDTNTKGQFRLMVIEGIKGGFAPPKIRSAIEIEGDDTGATIVYANESKGDSDYQTKEGRLSAEESRALAKKLYNDFSALPRQADPHTDDWYDMDVGVEFEMDGFFWSNGAPSGCGQRPHTEELSIANKQQFGDLVQYLQELGADRAQEPTIKAII